MRVKMIINPISGTRTVQATAQEIADKLKSEKIADSVLLYYTKKEKDAYFEALGTSEDDCDCIVAVGGDGTVNEVLQGAIESQKGIPVAILAAGTVNDFARSTGLPSKTEEFCRMMKDFNVIDVDVGFCNGKHFANVVAGGGFSEVAYTVSPSKKHRLGKLAYYLNGAKMMPKCLKHCVDIVYEYDGSEETYSTFLFLVANSASVGGFSKIAPNAKINDGLFDVCIVSKLNVFTLMILLAKLKFGRHIKSKHVRYFQTDEIRIRAKNGEELPLDFDGEQIEKLPLTLKCLAGKLKLIMPKDAKLLV